MSNVIASPTKEYHSYTPTNEVWGYIGITGDPVCLSVRLSVQSKLSFGYNFWTKRDKAFILHICAPCDKTFLSVPKMLTLWPWPWLFDLLLEKT